LPKIRKKPFFEENSDFLKFYAFLLVIPPPPPCYNVIYLKEGPPVPVIFLAEAYRRQGAKSI
jgi:hypothetical protein